MLPGSTLIMWAIKLWKGCFIWKHSPISVMQMLSQGVPVPIDQCLAVDGGVGLKELGQLIEKPTNVLEYLPRFISRLKRLYLGQ